MLFRHRQAIFTGFNVARKDQRRNFVGKQLVVHFQTALFGERLDVVIFDVTDNLNTQSFKVVEKSGHRKSRTADLFDGDLNLVEVGRCVKNGQIELLCEFTERNTVRIHVQNAPLSEFVLLYYSRFSAISQ